MTIIKTQTPYELLIRWKDGAVAGAHVKFLEQIVEDGVVLHEKEGDATPVSMAGEAGYPLADILTFAQSTALATADTAIAGLAAEKSAHEATKALLAEKPEKAA